MRKNRIYRHNFDIIYEKKKTIKRSRKPVDRNNPEFSLFRTIKNHKSQMFNFSNLIPHELNQSLELNFESGNSKKFQNGILGNNSSYLISGSFIMKMDVE